MRYRQQVYLAKSQSGALGLFTGRFMAFPISSIPESREALLRYIERLGFSPAENVDPYGLVG